MVLPDRIELSTSPLPRECSTTELRQRRLKFAANHQNRGDPCHKGAGIARLPLGGVTPEITLMATWAKCTDTKGQTVWVNMDNVTMMMWRDQPQRGTEIILVGGGQVIVRDRPEDMTAFR